MAQNNKIKWDGHTHTELCRHGSGDSTAAMVEKSIELGFSVYSITEHAPVPEGLMGDKVFELELGLGQDEMQTYFKLIKDLKRIYGKKIEIRSGLEVDYLPGYELYTQEMLKEWNHELEEILFSVHFMQGKGGIRCIDFTPEDFCDGLISHYGDALSVHHAYWRMIKDMLALDLNFNKPIRIGHLALIYKFYKEFPLENATDFSAVFFEEILKTIQQKGYSLDYNMAGNTQKLWQQPYMLEPIFQWCQKYGIDLVYGSDAHKVSAVGQYHAQFEQLIQNKIKNLR